MSCVFRQLLACFVALATKWVWQQEVEAVAQVQLLRLPRLVLGRVADASKLSLHFGCMCCHDLPGMGSTTHVLCMQSMLCMSLASILLQWGGCTASDAVVLSAKVGILVLCICHSPLGLNRRVHGVLLAAVRLALLRCDTGSCVPGLN
jgi:hypothetical protein